jgi:hypothetical protein
MCFHKQPTTQTDEDAKNVRNDQNRNDPLVAMPSVSQQNPSHHSIKPGRREGVADPARHLIRRERPVEAARSGHRFFCVEDSVRRSCGVN